MFYPLEKRIQTEKDSIELNYRISVLNHKLDKDSILSSDIDKEISSITNKYSNVSRDSLSRDSLLLSKYKNQVYSVKDKHDSLNETYDKHELEMLEINLKNEQLKYNASLLAYYNRIAIFGLIIGSILMSHGFISWYYKVQRPLDLQNLKSIEPPHEKSTPAS